MVATLGPSKAIEPPPLRWLLDDAERRRQALQYWIYDTASGLLNTAVHEGLKALPIDACSYIGAFNSAHSPLRYAESDARARRNWKKIRPNEADPASVDAAMRRLWRSVGRTMAEFSVIDRLWDAGRINVEGVEYLQAARDTGKPILIACLHLGNWEVTLMTGLALGFAGSGIYLPPDNRFDHRIAVKARAKFGGHPIYPGPGALRAAMRALASEKSVFSVFVDECVHDHVFAPAFGRPIKAEGNIAYIVRLAWMSGATIIPAFCLRLGDCARFKVTALHPINIKRDGRKPSDLLENIAIINSVIEPIVTRHLDQWYYLLDLELDPRD
jgi:Kdo2-lipid IVA lauroyltransferase/acyltransferase